MASRSSAFQWSKSATRVTSPAGRRSSSSTSILCTTSWRGSTPRDRRAPRWSTGSPGLWTSFDFVVAFSLRYYTAFHAARLARHRAVLVPTTERDPALGLAIFGPVLRSAGAIMYNSPEERALIEHLADTQEVPAVTVGVGSQVPEHTDPDRARRAFGLDQPFIVYVGRIDAEQGLRRALRLLHALLRPPRAAARSGSHRNAGAAGAIAPPYPSPGLRHGPGQVRRDRGGRSPGHAVALREPVDGGARGMGPRATGARQRTLRRPGRAVSAQQRRPVSIRTAPSSRRCSRPCWTIATSPRKWARMVGASTRRHYAWEVIEGKYLDMFDRLQTQARGRAAGRAGTGWLERRRRRLAARSHAGERGAGRTGSEIDTPVGSPIVKLAFVTPRYGADIVTGPEHACRLMAEHISRRHDVDVMTTCAAPGRLVEERVPGGAGPRARRPDPALSGLAAALGRRAVADGQARRRIARARRRAASGPRSRAPGAPACSTTCGSSTTPTTPSSSSR